MLAAISRGGHACYHCSTAPYACMLFVPRYDCMVARGNAEAFACIFTLTNCSTYILPGATLLLAEISHFLCIFHTLDNAIWISICIVNHIELGGILVQSIHIAADSGWHLGWPIHIAAFQRWHIDRSIHIAAPEQRHVGRPIHIIAALTRDRNRDGLCMT